MYDNQSTACEAYAACQPVPCCNVSAMLHFSRPGVVVYAAGMLAIYTGAESGQTVISKARVDLETMLGQQASSSCSKALLQGVPSCSSGLLPLVQAAFHMLNGNCAIISCILLI